MRWRRLLFDYKHGIKPVLTSGIAERSVSTQQVRNLLRRMNGTQSPESKLKTVLYEFVQAPGHEALLIQDQVDTTIGLVLQSAAQKACFGEWGDTLVMDWTHSTNNIGFHLGTSAIAMDGTGNALADIHLPCIV